MAQNQTDERYMILSSDTHAGAQTRTYREFLDPAWHDDFDAWEAAITNPWIDLRDMDAAKVNWDSDARTAACDAEGITGEVLFPNTLTPFYDILVHLSGVPDTASAHARRWAGLQAHNRWLVEFCSYEPKRRKGLIQLLPNDLDDAIAEVRWAAETGVIGGVMIPAIPPNHTVEPFFHPRYDPLWDVCSSLAMPVHQHMGSGCPDLGDDPVAWGVTFTEYELWPKRTLIHLILGGVFERFPDLRVVWTEMWGMRWILEELNRIDQRLRNIQSKYAGDPRTLNYAPTFGSDTVDSLSLSPIEYWQRNCRIGASMLPRSEVQYRHAVGLDTIMWGADFPHDEGSIGYTTQALAATMWDVPTDECQKMLTDVAADLYNFDTDTLAPIAARIGPPIAEVHTPLEELPASKSLSFNTDPALESVITV
ncbi:amidohydrolase family protein [Candidatus Poriferisocius sp.]|uniref:amidohydrolase family protein n=1 Tax=Candidatus Poriferisocius sp. TaxID=3101276 RepID=UPI003B01052F